MILDNTQALPAVLSEQAEDVIYQMAQEMGILVTVEEAAALEKALENVPLTEQQNIVRLNRQAKMDSLVVRSALVIAQQKKDALFAKYAKAAALKRTLRAMIVKKFGGQATMTARKLLSSAGKRNLVDVPAKASTFSHPESRG
jgi:hypothetical protein